MKSSTSFGFSSSILFFFIVAASINVVYSEDEASNVVDSETARTCSYTLMVWTGTEEDAGTDSRISVTLGNINSNSNLNWKQVEIPDLKEWGTMPPGHDYFEKGKEDNFRVNSSVCYSETEPVCKITVTSDGSGPKPGWLLRAVDVSQEVGGSLDGPVIFNFNFGPFGAWLDKDEPPSYKLTATIDKCNY